MGKRAFSAALAVSMATGIVVAYDNTVHYYTTEIVMRHIAPDITEVENRIVAFCAQLPDETTEYDALSQYRRLASLETWNYFKWARADLGSPEMAAVIDSSCAVREMVTVQQLLHGLTGGDAGELLSSAEQILIALADNVEWGSDTADENNQLCAIGFAVHLLGDARAHRKLGSSSANSAGTMYGTGSGHFSDKTRPDKILQSETGIDGWVDYKNHIPSSMPGSYSMPSDVITRMRGELEAAAKKWFGKNRSARNAVLEETASWATNEQFAPGPHPNEPCQDYLDSVFPNLVPDMEVPHCLMIWDLFSAVAISTFDSVHGSRTPILKETQYLAPVEDAKPQTCVASG